MLRVSDQATLARKSDRPTKGIGEAEAIEQAHQMRTGLVDRHVVNAGQSVDHALVDGFPVARLNSGEGGCCGKEGEDRFSNLAREIEF